MIFLNSDLVRLLQMSLPKELQDDYSFEVEPEPLESLLFGSYTLTTDWYELVKDAVTFNNSNVDSIIVNKFDQKISYRKYYKDKPKKFTPKGSCLDNLPKRVYRDGKFQWID